MEILFISFFHDTARYFAYLEECFKKQSKKNIETTHLSIYPSSNMLLKSKNISSIKLYEKIKKIDINNIEDIIKKNNYKDLNLDECIFFNNKSHRMNNLDMEIRLKKIAVKYIYYYEDLLKENNFDYVILFGDTRMSIKILKIIAERYNIKTVYFEQGPYNTTIMDEKGVNNNMSFCEKPLSENTDKNALEQFFNKKKKIKFYQDKNYKKPFLYRLDLLYLYPPNILRKLIPADLQTGEKFIKRVLLNEIKDKFNRKIEMKDENYPLNMISLMLQVPIDAQMIYHSPNYDNFLDIIKDVHENIPNKYNLVVREHPRYLGNYNKEIYEYINNNSNISLINDGGLNSLIEKSKLVIVNNSTVGLEALKKYKPVITLGNAYYDRNEVTYSFNKDKNLGDLINVALKKGSNRKEIDKFLYNFLVDYLYNGHFQDKNLVNGDKIVKDILNNN